MDPHFVETAIYSSLQEFLALARLAGLALASYVGHGARDTWQNGAVWEAKLRQSTRGQSAKTYVCVYIYIQIYVYTCMYIYIYISRYVLTFPFVQTCPHINTHIHVCVCVCLSLSLYLSLSAPLFFFFSLSLSLPMLYAQIEVHIQLSLSLSVSCMCVYAVSIVSSVVESFVEKEGRFTLLSDRMAKRSYVRFHLLLQHRSWHQHALTPKFGCQEP